jgi:hypothetical protein
MMTSILRKAVIGLGVAGALAVAAAVPSLAQVVVVDPGYGYGYGGRVYVGPYGGYAYAPGYGSRYWDYPAGYDTGGMPYSYRELGWQPGPPGSAPANPCWPSQRANNRC